MELPVYITVEEVQRVCRELGVRDWTQLSEPWSCLKKLPASALWWVVKPC
jgi:hypothetical protein